MSTTVALTGCQAAARMIVQLRADHYDDQATGALKALIAVEMASGLDYPTALQEVKRLQVEARRALAGAA